MPDLRASMQLNFYIHILEWNISSSDVECLEQKKACSVFGTALVKRGLSKFLKIS